MLGSPVIGNTARGLLVTLATITAVAVVAVIAMTLIAAGAVGGRSSIVVISLVALSVIVPGVVRRRGERHRRRLRRRVGDPAAVSGVWRRLLAGAWAARDQFATAAGDTGSSPLGERLADHQSVVDATLERCGSLARDGELMARQLRSFRPRALRRDLRSEQRRDPSGARARALATQVEEAERLAAHVRAVHDTLEAQVHDLRSAAWRAAALRTAQTDDRDSALRDLLIDLVHLREAMETVDAAEQPVTVVDTGHRVPTRSASPAGRRYDV